MIPLSRIENLVVEEIGNEVILFDELKQVSHSLSPFAARVWHHANGRNSVKEIAALLEKEFALKKGGEVDARGVVQLALEELEAKGLMAEAVAAPVPVGLMRRSMLKGGGALLGRAALVSLFPLIRSVAVADERGRRKGHDIGKGKGHDPGHSKGRGHDIFHPYPFELSFDSSSQGACMFFALETAIYYSDQPTLVGSESLYTEQDSNSEAQPGFYSDGSNWFEYITAMGFFSSGGCSGAPTPVAPTPVAPTPKTPTPATPTPKTPTPASPTPDAPTPAAPTPGAWVPVSPTPWEPPAPTP